MKTENKKKLVLEAVKDGRIKVLGENTYSVSVTLFPYGITPRFISKCLKNNIGGTSGEKDEDNRNQS